MNFELDFNSFKFHIRIQKQDASEKGKSSLWRLQLVTRKSVFSKAYGSRYEAFSALDSKLAELLSEGETQTNRVVYANIREVIQALRAEELTAQN